MLVYGQLMASDLGFCLYPEAAAGLRLRMRANGFFVCAGRFFCGDLRFCGAWVTRL